MTARARQRGLRGGWSLSKTVVDPITGRNWDLLNPEDVKAAWNLFYQTQPKLLVTFPPYEPDGEFMIELAIDMCLAQAKAGRYFAFECAELVNCWHLPCMLRLYSVQNAHKIVLVTDSGERRMVVTNSQAIDSFIGMGQSGAQRQTLCDAMIDGLLAECGDESHCEGVLYQFDQHPDMCDPDEICLQGFDGITGDQICPELIQQAREEELNGFREMEVYEYVSREEALSDPTGIVVGVRWVDHNKGTSVSPEVRSRLVAQEFPSKDRRDDLFAATPPLAATRFLLAGLACSCKGGERPQEKIMLVDVKKAFLHGSINRHVDIRLPEEDEKAKEGKWMGRLKKAMYGTRDAPAAWQSEVERTMKEAGFKQSPTTPCVCFNEKQTCGLLSMWMISCALGLSQGLQTFVGVSKTSM